jgi:hypothetical protein
MSVVKETGELEIPVVGMVAVRVRVAGLIGVEEVEAVLTFELAVQA